MSELAEVYTKREHLIQAIWVMPFTVEWVVDHFLTQYEQGTVAFKRSRYDPEVIIDGKPCPFGSYLVRDGRGSLQIVSEETFHQDYEKFYTEEDMAKVLTGVNGSRPGDIAALMEKYQIPCSVLIGAINEYIDSKECKKRRLIDGYPL